MKHEQPTDGKVVQDDWVECWNCGGEGFIESCFEDTCVCLEPPCCTKNCDVCRGNGGWERSED